MWDCCCEYEDTGNQDDCCPDWCGEKSKKVKGRFGLAFIAETPCCCPEPIGWQIEFSDTPSKVEQRCKEMVQWANCPPLPRCEPCPPIEVRSPCFPPRCNPCCPIPNPCPPPCVRRCCKCSCGGSKPPRAKSPKKKCCKKKRDCSCCPSEKENDQKCKCHRHTTRTFMD